MMLDFWVSLFGFQDTSSTCQLAYRQQFSVWKKGGEGMVQQTHPKGEKERV